MRKQSFLRTTGVLIILTLILAMASQTASAMNIQNVKTWYWGSNTVINSVATGDVDGDGKNETVTGGYYNDGTRDVAQLCVWDGSTLAVENVKVWYWTGNTRILSVAVGDVDGDGKAEVVTGGWYYDGAREVAQLCVWDGATIALENVKVWYWTGNTYIQSVAVGDVDGDGKAEIVTGGYYNDGTQNWAQLCVWDGATLTFKNVMTWHWTNLMWQSYIYSVAVGDVDGDDNTEIVTGGYYHTGYSATAQFKVFDGATLTYENGQTWDWSSSALIYSVAVRDVDGDGKTEIVTGGYFNDGTRNIAQLTIWGMI